MRRLLTALLAALLVGSLLPLTAIAGVPAPDDKSPSTAEDTPVAITLTATEDSGPDVSAFTPSSPSHGSVTSTGDIQCDGQTPNHCSQEFTYTPDDDYNGSDSFSYTATSDGSPSTSATVSITITSVNDVPSFTVGGDVTVGEDSGSYSGSFITNGDVGPSDESAQTLSYTVEADGAVLFSTQPAVSSSGGLTFTPAANAHGTSSVWVRAEDSAGAMSNLQYFDITISSVNDPVLAKNDALGVKATVTTVLNPMANDSGGAGETLAGVTITAVTKPSKGSATITNGGTRVTYDPTACATGGDVFSYTISDGSSTSTKSVAVTINRPGQGGNSTSPLTDTPMTKFVTNSTMGTTIPLRLTWCGVTTSTTSVRSHKVQQSTNSGSTYPTTLASATTAKGSTRNVSKDQDYRWRVRTVDTAGRTGSYRSSLVSIVRRYQDTSGRITYSTGWGSSSAGTPSGGTEKYTKTAGKTAQITVTNVRAFAIVGPKSSTRGSFKVYVDNSLVATVSETGSSTVYRRILYWRPLTSGTGVSHTIRIESSTSARVDIDAILTLAAV